MSSYPHLKMSGTPIAPARGDVQANHRARPAPLPPYAPPAQPDWRLTMIGSMALILLIVLTIIGLCLALRMVDWQPVVDFIAPTAAQARDTGWVALSERP